MEYSKIRKNVVDTYLEVHPIFESLHDEPEFKAIFKRARKQSTDIIELVKEMKERGELDL